MAAAASSSSSISAPERKFIANGIEQNIRNDGRERLDFRAFSAECGVIPQANGSCRLRIESTDVLVGVKLDLAEPDPQTPNAGRVVVTVECSPSASQDFEGRGADALNAALSSGLERVLLDSRSLRLEELSVIPGRQCWVLHVDALVIDSDGSLLDALALATRAALKTTAVPAVSVVTGDDGEQEIEVSDNPFDSKALACADDVPVTVSLTKIGTCFVVDATLAEEQCMSSRVTFGVTRSGAIAGTHKSGAGGLSPAALMEMTRAAKRIGLERITKLDVALGSAGKPKAGGAAGAAAAAGGGADAGDSKGMEDDDE